MLLEFQKELAKLPLEERIARVRKLGFAGIYVDRRAYTQEELDQLEKSLEIMTGSEKMVSDNNCLSYFNFEN